MPEDQVFKQTACAHIQYMRRNSRQQTDTHAVGTGASAHTNTVQTQHGVNTQAETQRDL